MNISRLFIMILTALQLGACGSQLDLLSDFVVTNVPGGADLIDPRSGDPVAHEFDELVYRFEDDTGIRVEDIPISFGDLRGGVAGTCYVWRFGHKKSFKEIKIDREYYERIKDKSCKLEQLVYHELGHCVLERDHDDTVVYYDDTLKYPYSSMPTSIMRSHAFNSWECEQYYTPHHDYYIQELGGHIEYWK